jgi:flagellar hook-associated protein 2
MGSTSAIFSGSSRYSQDFQSAIDRSVAIASLPLAQSERNRSELQSKSDAMSRLDDLVAQLDGAVKSLESSLGMSSFASSVSDEDAAAVSLSTGVYAGSYEVQVVSLGTKTLRNSTATASALTSNISTSLTYRLTVGSTTKELTLTSNTITALADAINAAGLDVQATVVNTGGSSSPTHTLSLQATRYGSVDVALEEKAGETWNHLLPTSGGLGTDVKYKVNGSGEITGDSRSISFSPGLTIDVRSAASFTVDVSRRTAATENALQAFALAYNDIVSEVDSHRGQEAGVLGGDPVLFSISEALRDLTRYSSSGSIASLGALGLVFDDDGKLSLDTSLFTATVDGDFEKLRSFVGSSTGAGFLKSATSVLNGLRDSSSGTLVTALQTLDDQIAAEDAGIEAQTKRIDLMRETLTAQMAAADALIASLEQQVMYISGMFESMRVAANSY